ncbi:tetratricopeptide repeat protein [bacterium]|nr:tetratricopeptide repeat protein [bacterium]
MKIRFMIIALIVAFCSCNSPKDSTYNQQTSDPDPSLSRPGKGFENTRPQERETKKTENRNQRKHEFVHPYIPSINANINEVKFFESPYSPPPKDQRQYRMGFDARAARYINWELNLTHNAPGKPVSFKVDSEWFKNGEVFYRYTVNYSIQADWAYSYNSHGYSMAPWTQGIYRVDLSIGGQKIASEYFDVYNADCSGDISLPDTSKVDELRRVAESYRNSGNDSHYQDALLQLAIALHNRAGQCYINGNVDAAVQDFTEAIKFLPDFHMAFYHRGLALMDLKRPKDALADFDAAIKLNQEADYYAARGGAQFELENDSDALDDLNRAIDLDSKQPGFYHDRGIVQYYLGDNKNALQDLNQAATMYQSQNQKDKYQVVASDIDILEGRKQGYLKLNSSGRAFTMAKIKTD